MSKTTITFEEAVARVCGAGAVQIDGSLFYRVCPEWTSDGRLVLELIDQDESPMKVHFAKSNHQGVVADGARLYLREEFGEEAVITLYKEDNPALEYHDVFLTTETAAAIMDAMYEDVCRQSEGSDSAKAELYEAAKRVGGGFALIWNWVAAMAMGARGAREESWNNGKTEFIDCVSVAAQVLHNYVTDPKTDHEGKRSLHPDQIYSLWQDVDKTMEEAERERSKYQREAEIEAMRVELIHASMVGDYMLGEWKASNQGAVFTWTCHGGAPVTVARALGDDRWWVNADRRTLAPQPSIAFRLWRDYFPPA